MRNARSFQVWEGGGEYNVARAMRKCWRKRAAVVTALPKNDLGWLVEDFIMQGGVDMSHVIWRDFDGLGRNTRVGLNFTEKGFGIRPALGCSDRGHSAASQIKPGEVNWEKLFGEEGVRWFHTGGIFAALAPNTVRGGASRRSRWRRSTAPSWRTISTTARRSGRARAARRARRRVNRNIAKYVDVMIGNEEDFTACLGFEVEGADEHLTNIETDELQEDDPDRGRKQFPNFKVAATTLRKATTATLQRLVARCSTTRASSTSRCMRENLEIYDRVGGGDGFASGLAYGFLEGKGPQAAVEYGAAHGALAMTTPGDTSMVRVEGSRGGDEGQGRARHSDRSLVAVGMLGATARPYREPSTAHSPPLTATAPPQRRPQRGITRSISQTDTAPTDSRNHPVSSAAAERTERHDGQPGRAQQIRAHRFVAVQPCAVRRHAPLQREPRAEVDRCPPVRSTFTGKPSSRMRGPVRRTARRVARARARPCRRGTPTNAPRILEKRRDRALLGFRRPRAHVADDALIGPARSSGATIQPTRIPVAASDFDAPSCRSCTAPSPVGPAPDARVLNLAKVSVQYT